MLYCAMKSVLILLGISTFASPLPRYKRQFPAFPPQPGSIDWLQEQYLRQIQGQQEPQNTAFGPRQEGDDPRNQFGVFPNPRHIAVARPAGAIGVGGANYNGWGTTITYARTDPRYAPLVLSNFNSFNARQDGGNGLLNGNLNGRVNLGFNGGPYYYSPYEIPFGNPYGPILDPYTDPATIPGTPEHPDFPSQAHRGERLAKSFLSTRDSDAAVKEAARILVEGQ